MTKTPRITTRIEENRKTITNLLSGIDTVKRLNNLNWLRHEISVAEPQVLFHSVDNAQFNFTSCKNLGAAYDYIVDSKESSIDTFEISKIHSILCAGTFVPCGTYRDGPVVLAMSVNDERFHAPESYQIPRLINEIVYKLNNGRESVLTKAFNLHYELVMLQPFHDCNKRTARFCMNKYLVMNGYRPIVFNYNEDGKNYINAIAARANGNKKAYTAYMQQCMLRTQTDLINTINKSRGY